MVREDVITCAAKVQKMIRSFTSPGCALQQMLFWRCERQRKEKNESTRQQHMAVAISRHFSQLCNIEVKMSQKSLSRLTSQKNYDCHDHQIYFIQLYNNQKNSVHSSYGGTNYILYIFNLNGEFQIIAVNKSLAPNEGLVKKTSSMVKLPVLQWLTW